MADNAQDQKDYQDYLDYQKYQESQGAQQPDSSGGLKNFLGYGNGPGTVQGANKDAQDYASANPEASDQEMSEYKKNLPHALAVGASQLLPVPGSALGRIAMNAGAGGVIGALKPASSGGDRATNAGISALFSGGLSAAGEGLAAGGSKLADYLMQKAAGMRKLTPGVGSRLVDQGLVGTRNMLTNQVEDKLPGAEEAVQGAVKGLTQPTSSDEMAQAIAAKGGKFVSPSGITLNSVAPDLEKVTEAAGQFNPAYAGREGPVGQLSPQDLLSLKRQGDWAGYTASGNPASATDSEIGRAVADKSRSLLSDMSGGDTADALANEQALILAKKALTKPETIHQGMGSTMFFGKYPGQSLIGSTAAQALQKGVSPAAKGVVDPRLLPSLFNK